MQVVRTGTWGTDLGKTVYQLYVVMSHKQLGGERGGSVVECRTLEREVGGSKPTAAVLCP